MKPYDNNEDRDEDRAADREYLSRMEQLAQKLQEILTADYATQHGLQPIKLQGPFVLIAKGDMSEGMPAPLPRTHELSEWQFGTSEGIWVLLPEVDNHLQSVLQKMDEMAWQVMESVSDAKSLEEVGDKFILLFKKEFASEQLLHLHIYTADSIRMFCALAMQRAFDKKCKG